MNKQFIIFTILALLIGVVILVVLFLSREEYDELIMPVQEPSIILTTEKEDQISIRDVRILPDTMSIGFGQYQLTNSIHNPQTPYSILYDHTNQLFLINILEHPIDDIRDRAVASLQTLLEVSTTELCQLTIFITPTFAIDPEGVGTPLPLGVCEVD